MWTTEDQTVAVGHSVAVDPTHWQELFDELLGRVAGRFARVEPRRRAKAFVRGLLADLPRKNCWTIAEHVGDPSPDGMQHLLGRAVWDEDALRDDVRAYLVEHLGRGELHDRGDQTEVIVVHCASRTARRRTLRARVEEQPGQGCRDAGPWRALPGSNHADMGRRHHAVRQS